MTVTETQPIQPVPPAPKPPGSVLRKLLVVFLAAAVLVVFAAIGWILWTDSRIDRIPGEELPSLQAAVDGPRTILVVGTDDRSTVPADFEDTFGDFEGSRTDVIMLVQFVPGEQAQILSIPRDLRVEIPGTGTNKVNAAFSLGGPELLIRTIRENLAIDINNYVEIDLAGFASLVEALGGVTLIFDNPARDNVSGLDVDAGVQTLNGEEALAYVRSRQYQEFRNGEWTPVSASDIGRTRRQQALMLALFDQVSSNRNPLDLQSFASRFASQVRVDAGLSLGVIVELGRAALDLNLSSIQTVTLPVDDHQGSDGRAYVIPTERAGAVLVAFRQGDPLPG